VEITKNSIISILKNAGSKGLKTHEIARNLGAASRDLKRLRSLLQKLESDGTIVRGRRRRYQMPEEAGFVKGMIFGYGETVAHLVPDDGSLFLKVPGESLGSAHHGDVVLARTVRGRHGGKEAMVMRVLERAASEVIGQITTGKGGRLVHVDHDRRHKSVAVEANEGAKPGDYVLVRVPKWGQPYERTRGRITEVLGGRFSPGEAFAGIVREFNLPTAFPQPVADEVEHIPAELAEKELRRRQDLTGLLTFTIDPEDAKDFDDAISIEEMGRGRLRIGVHIADVSHYVRQGSALDNEAMARGRSVYLVDRVIPMLPPKLSSDLAALRPDNLRLAVSIIMDVNRDGEVASYEIRESVIRSRARLTYDQAQRYIDKGAGWRAKKDHKRIAEALKKADVLRQTLRERRIKHGSIELDTPEVDIVVDSSGNTVDVKPTEQLDSHNLIEELMVLANETVATHMSYLGRLFVYRVHEVPDESDMKDLAVFAASMGYRFRWSRGTSPKALQSLMTKVKDRPEDYIVSTFVLRSLKKAMYSERNVGHFGLASKCYTHFTSPIRRYPDLLVHRLLKSYGLFKTTPKDPRELARFVRRAAEIASTREMEGDEAERAAIKARIVEYMEGHVGEEFWGIISGVKDFGFFVMLETNLIEGLVHVSTLGDDFYAPDSTGAMLIGSRTGRYYRVGDRVLIRVTGANREHRDIDFAVLGKEGRDGFEASAPPVEGRSRKRRQYRELQTEGRKARSSGRRRGAPGTKPPGKRGRAMATRRSRRGGRTAKSDKPRQSGR
jgi:ribonuclease R